MQDKLRQIRMWYGTSTVGAYFEKFLDLTFSVKEFDQKGIVAPPPPFTGAVGVTSTAALYSGTLDWMGFKFFIPSHLFSDIELLKVTTGLILIVSFCFLFAIALAPKMFE